jgi:hypothetical protein
VRNRSEAQAEIDRIRDRYGSEPPGASLEVLDGFLVVRYDYWQFDAIMYAYAVEWQEARWEYPDEAG